MTVMLVWLMLVTSGTNLPVVVFFSTQELCEKQLASTIAAGKQENMEINGACRAVRFAQFTEQEV